MLDCIPVHGWLDGEHEVGAPREMGQIVFFTPSLGGTGRGWRVEEVGYGANVRGYVTLQATQPLLSSVTQSTGILSVLFSFPVFLFIHLLYHPFFLSLFFPLPFSFSACLSEAF